MKYLKWLTILIAVLLLFYIISCLIGPKDLNITRTVSMKCSPSQVYSLVNDLKKWDEWNPWHLRDSSMVINYPGTTRGVGASYTWKGELSGTGSLEIIDASKNESIKTELTFGGYDGTSNGFWLFNKEGDLTNVSWGMQGDNIPFMARGVLLLRRAKSNMKADFDQGLENLKMIAEQRAKGMYNGFKINNVVIPEKHYVLNRQIVNTDQIQAFYMRHLPAISVDISKVGAETDGMPCGLFYKWEVAKGQIDMAAAIPVKEAMTVKGYMSTTIPERKALQVDYYGDYSETNKAHDAIEEYVADQGLFTDFPVVEQYITDPGTETDPSKWLTRITYYIAQED